MLEKCPEIKTERLDLIEIKQTYLDDYYKLFSDERVTEYYNIVPFKEKNDAQKQGNIASEKKFSKLGFKREGVLRDRMYWNEKHYDMTLYSLLRCEYF